MTDRFTRSLYLSLAGHGVLLVVIFVRAVLVPSEPIEIRRAIRVDVVALPSKMTELPPEPVKTPAPAPPPEPASPTPPKAEPVKETPKPKPETVNLNKAAKKKDSSKAQKDALAKLKALNALDKIKQDVSKETKKPAPIVGGNKVSEGNSLTGLDKIEYDRYFDDLEGKVRGNWNIPQWLAESPYKAQVQILIDERGFVTKKVMRRSSGNEVFDAKVFEAIDASSPLPPPPARLQGKLSTSGIILNFPE